MYCTNCGEKNNVKAKFCAGCGQPLAQDNTTTSVQAELNTSRHKQKKSLYLIISLVVIIVGSFIGKSVFFSASSPTKMIYDGLYSVSDMTGSDFILEFTQYDESITIEGSYKLGDNLMKSAVEASLTTPYNHAKVGYSDGELYRKSDGEIETEDISDIMNDLERNTGYRFDYNKLVENEHINQDIVFKSINQLMELGQNENDIPVDLPKSETIHAIIKDFLIDYTKDKKIQSELFDTVNKVDKNHYTLSINALNFWDILNQYLTDLEGNSKKLKTLDISNRDIVYIHEGITMLDKELDNEGRDEMKSLNTIVDISLTPKQQLNSLDIYFELGHQKTGVALTLKNQNQPSIDTEGIKRTIERADN
ncbi:MAG: hypothetical protein ACTJHC_08625 [Vagococcus sp.]